MNATESSYKGFTIRNRLVLSEAGNRIAFEILNNDGYILGIYNSADRAKKIIDRNGQRWIRD